MKKTTENEAKIIKLNRIYKELAALPGKFSSKGTPKAVERLFRKSKELSAEFDKLRTEMPPVKFDMANGEYFYAESGDGLEMFAVKVRPTKAYYVRIAARSAGEAVDRAKFVIADREKIPLADLEAEDWSR